MDGIRIGHVTAVDKKHGMVCVSYQDKDYATTGFLPYLTYASEYKMPKVNDMVLVAHLSNGMASEVVIGGFWNKGNVPDVKDSTGWKKFISESSYLEFDVESNTLRIHAPNIVFSCSDGTVNLNQWIKGGG